MTDHRSASNWVDREEPLEGKLAQVLSYQLDRAPDDPDVEQWALSIRGMVEADATEVHVATFLKSTPGFQDMGGSHVRLLSIALWHITKCGLVRDRDARRLEALREFQPPQEPLSVFLERAILRAPTGEEPPPAVLDDDGEESQR